MGYIEEGRGGLTLKIFCTLMECDVEQKIYVGITRQSQTIITDKNRPQTDQGCVHGLGEPFGLPRHFLLFISCEASELIVLCSNQYGNRRLVEPSCLSIPFLDTIEC